MNLLGEEISPYSKQSRAICNWLVEKLGGKISSSNKCYGTGCEIIQSIYNGTYFDRFPESQFKKDNNFNLSENVKIISECKGDWIKTKQLIKTSYEHLEKIRDDNYLPYAKKFYRELTFSGFFGKYFNHEFRSPFYCCIGEPILKNAKFQDSFITDVRKNLQNNNFNQMLKFAETLVMRLNYTGKMLYHFWNAIDDMFFWWKQVRDKMPVVYNAIKELLEYPSILEDYYVWLCNFLSKQEGDNYLIQPWYFNVGSNKTERLSGYFSVYIREFAKKCQALRDLPKNICNYYTPESFTSNKPVDEIEELVIEDFVF